MLTFSTRPWIWSFHVVVLLMPAKKYTKTYNARVERLFLLFKPIVLWRSRCRCRRRCLSSLSSYHLGGIEKREKSVEMFKFLNYFYRISPDFSSNTSGIWRQWVWEWIFEKLFFCPSHLTWHIPLPPLPPCKSYQPNITPPDNNWKALYYNSKGLSF